MAKKPKPKKKDGLTEPELSRLYQFTFETRKTMEVIDGWLRSVPHFMSAAKPALDRSTNHFLTVLEKTEEACIDVLALNGFESKIEDVFFRDIHRIYMDAAKSGKQQANTFPAFFLTLTENLLPDDMAQLLPRTKPAVVKTMKRLGLK